MLNRTPALITLRLAEREALSTEELAEHAGVSPRYMRKIVAALRGAGKLYVKRYGMIERRNGYPLDVPLYAARLSGNEQDATS